MRFCRLSTVMIGSGLVTLEKVKVLQYGTEKKT